MRPVNLLPEQHRSRSRSASARQGAAYAVLGVLAALLVMALAYTLTANQVSSKRADTAAANQEADRLQARNDQLGPFGDFAAVKQTRLASVRRLAQSRFDWERLMRELARVLPDGSWLQETNASVTGELDGADGASTSAAGAKGSGQPSANLVGCTPHQSDVARMMVQLREAHRVDDVQLNESGREDGPAEVSVDSCGRLYKFDVTVTFAPETVEAPEGAKKVPASLGGGS